MPTGEEYSWVLKSVDLAALNSPEFYKNMNKLQNARTNYKQEKTYLMKLPINHPIRQDLPIQTVTSALNIKILLFFKQVRSHFQHSFLEKQEPHKVEQH